MDAKLIKVLVDNRIRMNSATIPTELTESIKNEFVHSNPSYFKLKSRGFYPGLKEPKYYQMWEKNGDEFSIPRGGYKRFKTLVETYGYQLVASDKRVKGKDYTDLDFKLQLYPFQEEIVAKCLEVQNCIITAPTGSGKTISCLGFAARANVPVLVISKRVKLMNMWVESVGKAFGLGKKEVGVIQGKKLDLKPITVAMQKTMSMLDDDDWEKINNYFGAVIIDECHNVGSVTYTKVVDRLKARYRIGVSADHTRPDGKQFLTEDMFGVSVLEIDPEELTKAGIITPVDVILVETEFYDPMYEMQRRIVNYNDAGISNKDILDVLKPEFEFIEDSDLNIKVPDYTLMATNLTQDKARNKQALGLLEGSTIDDKRVLVLTGRVEHAKALRDQIDALPNITTNCGLLIGGVDNSKEFDYSIGELRLGNISIAVGTVQAVGEGTDIPNLDLGILMWPIKARQVWNQIKGRYRRKFKNKTKSTVYVMFDKKVFGLTQVKNHISWDNDVYVKTLDGAIMTGKEYLKLERQRNL